MYTLYRKVSPVKQNFRRIFASFARSAILETNDQRYNCFPMKALWPDLLNQKNDHSGGNWQQVSQSSFASLPVETPGVAAQCLVRIPFSLRDKDLHSSPMSPSSRKIATLSGAWRQRNEGSSSLGGSCRRCLGEGGHVGRRELGIPTALQPTCCPYTWAAGQYWDHTAFCRRIRRGKSSN